MAQTRAITRSDLEPLFLTILFGLVCFILCIIAAASRSKVTWIQNSQCVYSGSGKTPLLCAAIAFVELPVAVIVEHMYIWVTIMKAQPRYLVASLNRESTSSPAKDLTRQAAFFLIAAWVFFALAEILLLVGISVESRHLKNWSRPRPRCFIIKPDLFTVAGIFALVTVFLAAWLYLHAVRERRLSQKHENLGRQMVEASALNAAPPGLPPHGIATVARENPVNVNQIERLFTHLLGPKKPIP